MVDLGIMDLERYDRQIRIPGWGVAGQERLRKASILVAGVGGLGSCSAMLLASAGIGRLRIVDRDVVERSNLNRQTLHWEKDIGVPKVESAKEKLVSINSNIRVEALAREIDHGSVRRLVSGMDGIVDGLDNFPARYVLNEEAVARQVPFFHGSVYAFEGRATTILPGKSPCLRCIYQSGPSPGPLPIAGPVPFLIGSVQAMEATKFLMGCGRLLLGRMLICDGEDWTFREIDLQRSPNCPACGELPPTA